MSGADLDPEVERFVRAGAGRPGAAPADLVKETPIAKVFLLEGVAYKLKKPVDFGFVDYSSLAKRRWAVERELEFNRPHAGDIYRAARPVVRDADGALRLGEPQEADAAVEWALEMRRFDEDAILAHDPSRVSGDFAESLGRQVARMQAAAPARPEGGGTAALGYTVRSNAEQLRALAGVLGAEEVEALLAATDEAFSAAAPLLEARRAAGLARRCHGDLHLANIVVEDGRAVPFDCIEFNDRLSEIDVLYDTAFLLMDLAFRGCRPAANRVLNGWLDEAARADGEAAWTGLALLPLFLSVRAAVRAHVSAHADAELGRRYLREARAHLHVHPPRLRAVGGLSGSGKSTRARALAPDLGGAPGAVVLRSDEVRKRLWGRGPLERLPPEAYGEAEGERTYAALLETARRVLDSGRSVVLDAVFLRPNERAAAARLARDTDVDFAGEWLTAPAEVLRARVSARTGDASDADLAVLDAQSRRDRGALGEGWREAAG